MKCPLNILKNKDQKGAVLVEFAFVAIILLIIFGSIVELSLALYNKNVLDNASRVGARAKIVAGATAVEDKIVEYCKGPDGTGRLINLVDGHVAVAVNDISIDQNAGDWVVSVKYKHPFMLVTMIDAMLGMLGAGPIGLVNVEITGTTVMRPE
jgi:hypothetical protein